MSAAIAAWWRARTERERRLVQGAALLIFVILAPAWAYLAARDFRDASAAELENARGIEAQIALLTETAAAAPEDVSPRGIALAAAEAAQMQIERVEDAGAGVRVVFAPTDSLRVYRWLEQVGSAGGAVTRSAIVRVDESDQVRAEFEVSRP